MKKHLLIVLVALGAACTTSEDPEPVVEAPSTEIITEDPQVRRYITVDPDQLSGWFLAKGYGGDSLFVQHSELRDSVIYSPDYLHLPDTLESLRIDLWALKVRARWDMTGSISDTTWIKEYTIDWRDSTYSRYTLLIIDDYTYPDDITSNIKLEIL